MSRSNRVAVESGPIAAALGGAGLLLLVVSPPLDENRVAYDVAAIALVGVLAAVSVVPTAAAAVRPAYRSAAAVVGGLALLDVYFVGYPHERARQIGGLLLLAAAAAAGLAGRGIASRPARGARAAAILAVVGFGIGLALSEGRLGAFAWPALLTSSTGGGLARYLMAWLGLVAAVVAGVAAVLSESRRAVSSAAAGWVALATLDALARAHALRSMYAFTPGAGSYIRWAAIAAAALLLGLVVRATPATVDGGSKIRT